MLFLFLSLIIMLLRRDKYMPLTLEELSKLKHAVEYTVNGKNFFNNISGFKLKIAEQALLAVYQKRNKSGVVYNSGHDWPSLREDYNKIERYILSAKWTRPGGSHQQLALLFDALGRAVVVLDRINIGFNYARARAMAVPLIVKLLVMSNNCMVDHFCRYFDIRELKHTLELTTEASSILQNWQKRDTLPSVRATLHVLNTYSNLWNMGEGSIAASSDDRPDSILTIDSDDDPDYNWLRIN